MTIFSFSIDDHGRIIGFVDTGLALLANGELLNIGQYGAS